MLALVGPTVGWRQRVARWASSGTVPVVAFCRSVEHLRASLAAGGAPAVLLDGDLPAVDRDLLAAVTDAGGLALVVQGSRRRQPWTTLGAAAVLPASFDVHQLHEALGPAHMPARAPDAAVPAPLLAVTGPGGTGASVAAIALAQGLAVTHGRVLLADCCLHAEQAMLHNAHGAQPGLADLVELHADGTPGLRQIRQMTVGVVERGYHLLLGLRRARHWSMVQPSSLEAALDSMRRGFDVVVADTDVEVEGEADGGSIDVEERNVLARTVLLRSDVVLVVGQPTMKGVYSLVRTMVDLLEFGVPPERLLPVVNQAAQSSQARAELSRAIQQLIRGAAGGSAVGPALFLPTVALEDRLRDRDALPETLPRMLAGATAAVLSRRTGRAEPASTPEPVEVGTIGHWDGPSEPS
jgi:cellulose biosynthesis protein BcsQ